MQRAAIRAERALRAVARGVPLASVLLAGLPVAHAQSDHRSKDNGFALKEIIVTATKRSENVQDVPMSIQALGTEKLDELHIQSFNDYSKLLPNVSTQTEGPGFSRVYIRGVSTEYNQSHSGPLPTVATYLDEQPVTTIQGTLDVHMYDIKRIEVLAGPQGTLYGASSEAGTIRIITNKPDPSAFKASYELEGNIVDHGSEGYVAEGFVNIPMSPTAAVRLVGWSERDAGYIDNVPGTIVYETEGSPICLANTNPPPSGCAPSPAQSKDHFNTLWTDGGRAALRIILGDSWTVTPILMTQETRSEGTFAFNPVRGDLKVSRFYPDSTHDAWWDAALTVQGRLSNLDIVYTGAFLKRDEAFQQDYVDYSIAYDDPVPAYMTDSAGNPANPSMAPNLGYNFKDQTHELRILTPRDKRLRFVGGAFWQRQHENINEHYDIDDLTQALTFPNFPHTWYLLDQVRIDRNEALFGQLSYDVLPKLTLTVGMRFYRYKNTNNGFVGFSAAGEGAVLANLGPPQFGQLECFAPGVNGAPCTNIDKRADGNGHLPKVSAIWRMDDQRMVYLTWARGYRPGGINRRPELPPFKADFLTSYELGWKTTWDDHRLRWNGALFWENWRNFQFSFVGQNGLSVFANGGQARIKGIESNIDWAVTRRFRLGGGFTLLDPILTKNYCGQLDASGNAITQCPGPLDPNPPLTPAGAQLAGTPKFKGDAIGRYMWQLGGLEGHVQAVYSYQSSVYSDTRMFQRALLGKQNPYGTLDLSTGIDRDSYTVELYVTNVADKRGQVTRYAECAAAVCARGGSANGGLGVATYVIPTQPRTIGIRFRQDF